jgi:hypothetical protein
MYKGKYGAVIGRETRFFSGASNNFQAMDLFELITAPYFPLYSKPRNFAKRQCKLQWLTPPSLPEGPARSGAVWQWTPSWEVLGFRVEGSGLRVQGSGFRVQGSGFRVYDFGFRV